MLKLLAHFASVKYLLSKSFLNLLIPHYDDILGLQDSWRNNMHENHRKLKNKFKGYSEVDKTFLQISSESESSSPV